MAREGRVSTVAEGLVQPQKQEESAESNQEKMVGGREEKE